MRFSDIILWVLFLFSIFVTLWYFFGNSPSIEQMMLAFLFTAVFSLVINVTRNGTKIDYVEKELKRLRLGIQDSFKNMKDDVKTIKEGSK
jgi:multisubunit Na+/H+ antiporter MnhE subunit